MSKLVEIRPAILELCYIAQKRNEINLRRHRAKYKKQYYQNAIHVVEAHNKTNSKLRRLKSKLDQLDLSSSYNVHECANIQSQIQRIEKSMDCLVKLYPKPKKWKNMGLHKLRSLVLKFEGEYALAKHETMELTLRTRLRIKYLLDLINGSFSYDNGSIVLLTINSPEGEEFLRERAIAEYAKQHEIDLAVEEMLNEEVLST